jgi:ABC-2 type transport system permease protein
LRARPENEVNWRFDNVTFVLNVLDVLAGDARFVEVRKRETRYPTLQMVEARTAAAREQASEETDKFKIDYDQAVADAGERLKKPSSDLQEQINKLQESAPGDPDAAKSLQASMTRLVVQQQIEQRRLDAETERLRRERDQNMKRIDRRLESQIREVQTWFKFWAVVLPIVPPLGLGLVVFFRRRSRERESITVARRR